MADARVYTAKYAAPIATQFLLWERIRGVLVPFILLAADYGVVLAAAWTAYAVRAYILPLYFPVFDVPEVFMYVVIPTAFVFFLHFDKLYLRRVSFWQQAGKLFKVSVYAMLFVLVIMYFTGTAKAVSRIFVILTWGFSFSYLAIERYLLERVCNFIGPLQQSVVVIGAGKTAELLLTAFHNDPGLGYKVVGLIEDDPQPSEILHHYPIIGTFEQAEEAVRRTGVREVLIAAPGLQREELLRMVYRLQPYVDNITFVPDLFGIPVGGMELKTLFDQKTVLLKVRNNLAQEYNRVLKMTFDWVCSFIGLIIVLPVSLLIAAIIYIDAPGPVIFAHDRIGRKGKVFACYKFRTMVPNAEGVLQEYLANNPAALAEWERDFKLKDDPRITPIGNFLRKTSLDELPQFLNVLKGEMSLVGPRPIVQAEVARYDEYIHDYYLVRPGISGMWQVGGRNDIDYPERVQMDSWYVRNWSLWLDMVILLKTIKIVVAGKGAY